VRRSHDTSGPGALAAAGGGALVVGAAGFCAGFFGPIALNPDANQGPLVGIFITGPGGAILGAVVGGALGARGASWRLSIAALTATATLLVAGTLFFALPEPRFRGNVLELRVESCGSPLSLKQEVFDHWDERLAAASWAAVRPRWKEGFEAMAAADPGVVLGVAVTRSTGVYENRKPWNRGTLEGGKPWWVRERYFARGTCADWPVGTTGVFDAAADPRPSAAWPPDVLPSLLNLQVLTPSGPDRAALLR
jgi:MFS family permease